MCADKTALKSWNDSAGDATVSAENAGRLIPKLDNVSINLFLGPTNRRVSCYSISSFLK